MTHPSISSGGRIWRWLVAVALLGAFATVIIQSRSISRLRQENELLRAQPRGGANETTNPSTAANTNVAVDVEQLQKDSLELLRLRNEVRQLRERVTHISTPPPASPAEPTKASEARDDGEQVHALAIAAMQGNSAALDKLAKLAVAARATTNDPAATRSDLGKAFEALATEAGKGNAGALQALWQASRIQSLQGLAVRALGQAAGQGNEEALKPLLDPEAYLILRSSAVGALKPAADTGNARAIQALATTAADPNQEALWFLAAQGLETAASAGNTLAIDSLAALAAGQNQNARKQAILALEAAARNNQLRAEEALRKLGWR
jgi:hypothetical protein